jgi:pyruvate dehydrogenase E1 component beta subunit
MRQISYAEAIREALHEEMTRDARVFIMGEDVELGYAFTVTKDLINSFPDRVFNTPIAELGFTGAGVGAAMTGLRPVVEIQFGDFLTVAMDPLVNQAAKLRYMTGGQARIPLTVRTPMGILGGLAGQHSQTLYAWLVHVPGLLIAMPSTPYDAKGLLKTAIRDDNPVIFFEHKRLYSVKGPVPEEEYLIPFGKADIKRQGKDVTIVAIGYMVPAALKAAETLAAEGIECSVVDPRTACPLDMDTIIADVRRTSRLVIVDEGNRTCGFGAEIAARVAEEALDALDAPIRRVAPMDAIVPFSPPLEQAVIPNENTVADVVRKLLA